MKILFPLIILTFLWLYKLYKTENFIPERYKVVTVTPQPSVYTKLTLYVNEYIDMCKQIAINIQGFFPIEDIKEVYGTYDVLQNMEKSKNTMGIVSNISYIDYIEKNPNSNIRHICNIGVSVTTLIVDSQANKRTWDDFRDRSYTFGVDYSESSSYIGLERILKFLLNENQHKIVELKYDSNTISNALKNKIIDGYFIITPHPDKTIMKLASIHPIYIIGTKGLDTTDYNMLFPYSNTTFIDATLYNLKMFGSIPSMTNRLHIVASKYVSNDNIYNFIRSLFENFARIKNVGDKHYIEQMLSFNPNFLYPTQVTFKIHDGARKYFEDIGIITYESNKNCVYTIGIDKCKSDLYINPYRLLI
jgi:TRAP-type uncharacterized transport system substrate-binding protein